MFSASPSVYWLVEPSTVQTHLHAYHEEYSAREEEVRRRESIRDTYAAGAVSATVLARASRATTLCWRHVDGLFVVKVEYK